MKIALGVEYDGNGFSGWQYQTGVRTVQACVETALTKVADHPVTVICAGRTDAGVHGAHQVVHLETQAVRSERAWVYGGNANLPPDIAILWAKPVPEDFHARFSATARAYRYLIRNHPVRSAIWAGRATWEYRPLDAQRMAQAAALLVGEHDFSAFRAHDCQAKHPVRTLHELDVFRHDEFIILEVRANAFLKHMVRNLAGVLMAIGMGKAAPQWAKTVLDSRDRRTGGVTAPPHGLYLREVFYPARYAIPPSSLKKYRGNRAAVPGRDHITY